MNTRLKGCESTQRPKNGMGRCRRLRGLCAAHLPTFRSAVPFSSDVLSQAATHHPRAFSVQPTLADRRPICHPKSIDAMAARLKLTRAALGLSQAELCRRADLSRNTYNQWERGHGRPDVHYAMRLCDAFGITLDWIYRGQTFGLPSAVAEMVLRSPPHHLASPPRSAAEPAMAGAHA